MIGLLERWERDVALGHTRVFGDLPGIDLKG